MMMLGYPLPAFGLDVVDVRVLPYLDRLYDLADVYPVLDDGVANVHVLERDFVTEGNVLRAGQCDRPVFVENQANQRLPGLYALDHDDCHRVARIVKHAMNHGAFTSMPKSRNVERSRKVRQPWRSREFAWLEQRAA
jgi:hypothetical protein